MTSELSESEKKYLLSLARETIECAVNKKQLPKIRREDLSDNLLSNGASFVTLTIYGELRGCIGSLEAHQSLVEDVQQHAVHAALEDYRFPPVSPDEVSKLNIEISRLTNPIPLDYSQPADLPRVLNPKKDGVILKDGYHRATFLPQVWEQLPVPEEFLSHLCVKMGSSADLWRKKKLEVSIYHVEEFKEE